MATKQRYVFVQTMGCQMNLYDSDRIVQVLRPDGYAPTEDPSQADLIVVNTCSIRDKAEQKMLSALGRYAPLKEYNDELLIGVAGCVATQERERLFEKASFLDVVIGPDNIGQLPDAIRTIRESSGRVIETKFFNKRDYDWIPVEPQHDGEVSAMLTIMKGCNKFCSFCVVPFTRGREVSKPVDLVVEETRRLVAHGVREVTLLGQNVNSYGKDRPGEPDFPELLAAVNEVEGLERIRFTTSHPWDCTDELVDCFSGKLDKVCEYFHLPVQCGSDEVLKKMRRGYTVASFLERMERLREVCPAIALSTDIIVGFPGETDDQFRMTLDILETVQFDRIFSFAYSERPGTAASRLTDDIPRAVKAERLQAVQRAQEEHSRQAMKRYAQTTVEVLVEGPSRKAERAMCGPAFVTQLSGRTRTHVVVNFDNDAENPIRPGDLVEVEVTDVYPHSLFGAVIGRLERAA